jgi:hypothetical protein
VIAFAPFSLKLSFTRFGILWKVETQSSYTYQFQLKINKTTFNLRFPHPNTA